MTFVDRSCSQRNYKFHRGQHGTAWFRQLTDPSAGNVVVTSHLSLIEVYSAFNRRLREAVLSRADYSQLAADFDFVSATEYQILEVTVPLSHQSRLLLEKHPLRAGDAVQLASAQAAGQVLQSQGLAALVFLAADDRLLDAARAEGLLVDDPRIHP